MQRDAVRATIQTAGLSRIQSNLEALMLNSVRLTSTPAPDDSLAVGMSKLGGTPDLPDAVQWPMMADVPLSFVAQINLTDAQSLDTDKLLPASGLLSFFYDANQQTYGSDPADRAGYKVLYTADTSTLKRRPFPDALPEAARFSACSLTLSSEVTLPQRPNLLDDKLDWNDIERKAYSDMMVAFPSEADHQQIHHRLLGHSDDLQDDMHLQAQLFSHGLTDDQSPEAASLLAGAKDWVLLLQVDSDPNANMQWASTGLLYFWISRQDLQAGNFDKGWVVLQSE